ncbi:hypothetical protein DFA_00906 [Cavenderia fasciculata]|uniref:Uncharacterized protein n=1 Tax=Cavenderia fasciculata TaxID=261658 RepID=F4PUG4_CACFS|nr:uncharacterized protein DFA_00906 [Cavenderia fasciculata]EGG21036.1 hypothetical protein DFA_00906 [Cavenderia fasciculata]|eukprot:XP_004358886.1 hypothetical protein DFA_00906 [Cavenderia fasciculata]
MLDQQLYLDLQGLCALKTLTLGDGHYPTDDRQYCIEVSVPPSLKILYLMSECAHRTSLYNAIVGKITFNANVEKIRIEKFTREPILEGLVFPPSVTHLTISGEYEPVQLPESLIKLKMPIDNNNNNQGGLINLQYLKKLIYTTDQPNNNDIQFVLPSTSTAAVAAADYPPNLETLNLIQIKSNYTIDNLPPTIKYLSILLNNTNNDRSQKYPPIFSINSRLSNISQIQWLPYNTTHLTCQLEITLQQGAFRLDQVINHTNVRHLCLIISDTILHFSIQRLDTGKHKVLVLETKSISGGIITQRKTNYNQQYDPIYLHFKVAGSGPFELKCILNFKKL